jgi:hypothetical protein
MEKLCTDPVTMGKVGIRGDSTGVPTWVETWRKLPRLGSSKVCPGIWYEHETIDDGTDEMTIG